MNILAIDTSCDETSVAITNQQKVISNVLFSQSKLHNQYGGVYPSLAKREHLINIKPAINLALKRAHLNFKQIKALAITFGPGLAPALEVGISATKELSQKYNLPVIPVDHIEGHIYSVFATNQNNLPNRQFRFPILAFVISGGHTELILLKDHINYQIVGSTLDDAAGEALDKAARVLGLGYPGGPIIENLAKLGDPTKYILPIPMIKHKTLDFSYSGLKTAFKRVVYSLKEAEKLKELSNLAASFQQAVFKSLLLKLEKAVLLYQPKLVTVSGGVSDNKQLRKQTRALLKSIAPVYFTALKNLTTDNAAMIGVAAFFKYQKGIVLKNPQKLERIPRANLDFYVKKA